MFLFVLNSNAWFNICIYRSMRPIHSFIHSNKNKNKKLDATQAHKTIYAYTYIFIRKICVNIPGKVYDVLHDIPDI